MGRSFTCNSFCMVGVTVFTTSATQIRVSCISSFISCLPEAPSISPSLPPSLHSFREKTTGMLCVCECKEGRIREFVVCTVATLLPLPLQLRTDLQFHSTTYLTSLEQRSCLQTRGTSVRHVDSTQRPSWPTWPNWRGSGREGEVSSDQSTPGDYSRLTSTKLEKFITFLSVKDASHNNSKEKNFFGVFKIIHQCWVLYECMSCDQR